MNDFRGTYNVSDYRWFNLRDGDSTSPNFQVRYGLLHDDYSEKPAFGVYRDLVAQLARRAAEATRNAASRSCACAASATAGAPGSATHRRASSGSTSCSTGGA